MSIIWMYEIQFSQILDYIKFFIMINIIINPCIIVIHPLIKLGVYFMNIYHEYNIICIYEEMMGKEGLGKSIVWFLL